MSEAAQSKPLGFWTCWSLTVGTMIGSGIFTVPAVLAKYGAISFGGWILSGVGTIALALVIGRLASRRALSGGPYVYVRDAFGDFAGFVVAWAYWASYWIAIPAIAVAFVGYLTVFVPMLSENPLGQAIATLALVWALTLINVRGLREGSFTQIAMTLLKLIPLLVIISLGAAIGETANFPAFNPANAPIATTLAATTLVTMWAFSGFEAGCTPASNVRDAKRTIPRALITGVIAVTFIYLAATAAIMALVPAETLAISAAPFAEAARGLGAWGPVLIAIGALIATAGALNGVIFVTGQVSMAVARDGLAPPALAHLNAGGSPDKALFLGATLGSILVALNYTRGLVDAFTFLLMMSTLCTLPALLLSAIAELRHSWRSALGWAAVAALGALYIVFSAWGSGVEAILWTLALLAIGVPFYALNRMRAPATP